MGVGENVILKQGSSNKIGTITDTYLYKRMRVYDVLLEDGTSVSQVRKDREGKFSPIYIDTKLSRIYNASKNK